jgi:hypothetical protein
VLTGCLHHFEWWLLLITKDASLSYNLPHFFHLRGKTHSSPLTWGKCFQQVIVTQDSEQVLWSPEKKAFWSPKIGCLGEESQWCLPCRKPFSVIGGYWMCPLQLMRMQTVVMGEVTLLSLNYFVYSNEKKSPTTITQLETSTNHLVLYNFNILYFLISPIKYLPVLNA